MPLWGAAGCTGAAVAMVRPLSLARGWPRELRYRVGEGGRREVCCVEVSLRSCGLQSVSVDAVVQAPEHAGLGRPAEGAPDARHRPAHAGLLAGVAVSAHW